MIERPQENEDRQAQIDAALADLKSKFGLGDESLAGIRAWIEYDLASKENVETTQVESDAAEIHGKVEEATLALEEGDRVILEKQFADISGLAPVKELLNSVSANLEVEKFLSGMVELSKELPSLYEEVKKLDPKPSEKWLEEFDVTFARSNKAASSLLDVLRDAKSGGLPRPSAERHSGVIVKEWAERCNMPTRASFDGGKSLAEQWKQRWVEDVLMPNIYLLQLVFEAHPKECPALKDKLEALKTKLFPNGYVEAAQKTAESLGYNYYHDHLYEKNMQDFTWMRNVGTSAVDYHDLLPEVAQLDTETGTIYRAPVPRIVPANKDGRAYAPGLLQFTRKK